MSPVELPVALRYWPVMAETKRPRRKRSRWFGRDSRIGERVLVFDTETTADELQRLRFGFWRLYVDDICEREGVFVADDLHDTDPDGHSVIARFAERFGLEVGTRSAFVADVFFPEVKALGALCVGFNLPFDLSRIAETCASGRGANRDAFSFRLSENLFHPGIRVRPINAHAAVIKFLKAKRSRFRESRPFDGRFLDLHTLCYALSQESHGLYSAGVRFGAEVLKEEPATEDEEDAHGGPISDAYLRYARRDVEATYALYLALADLYRRLPFSADEPEAVRSSEDTAITSLLSPASIAKAVFRKMGIRPRLLPPEYVGYAASAFHGGRSEVRIQRQKVPAALVDFTSQYPAVFTLLDLWPIVTAQKVAPRENLEEVRELLSEVAADREVLFDPATWKHLVGYALVLPHGDFLPVRVPTEGHSSRVSQTVCEVSSEVPLWYALPDLAASVAVTGKVPRLLRAFTVTATGRQRGLRAVTFGDTRLDPRNSRFFADLVSERKRLDTDGQTHIASGVKAFVNSGSYGVFFEFNQNPLPVKRSGKGPDGETQTRTLKTVDATIYSDTTFQHAYRLLKEVPGEYANPFIASLVTAGGRLLIALAQLEAPGFVWIATDALAVTGVDADALQSKFQRLSPYDERWVPRFLKAEGSGTAYAISANRYCLLRDDGTFEKMSLHGMGAILPPNGERRTEFAEKVWRSILSDATPREWESLPLRHRQSIRSPEVWNRVRRHFPDIRPFSFIQSVSTPKREFHREETVTAYGPFRPDWKGSLKLGWLNTATNTRVKVLSYSWPDDDEEVIVGETLYCETIARFVRRYRSRFDVNATQVDGVSFPRSVKVSGVYYIGKESSRLEMTRETRTVLKSKEQREKKPREDLHNGHRMALKVLQCYPPSKVSEVLGVSRQYLGMIYRSERQPSPETATRLYQLRLWLPKDVPATFRERCAAVDEAAERFGYGKGQEDTCKAVAVNAGSEQLQ